MSDVDLKAIFAEMEKRFQKGKVEEPVVFYFSLGEADDDKWTLVIEPDECTVRPGKTDDADCFLKTDRQTFADVISGKKKPGPMDFMSGKIKSNDPFKLKVLQDVFGF